MSAHTDPMGSMQATIDALQRENAGLRERLTFYLSAYQFVKDLADPAPDQSMVESARDYVGDLEDQIHRIVKENSDLRAAIEEAHKAAAEVDRAGGDAPHSPGLGLAAWIRWRAEIDRERNTH